jgi:hypothetical protein
MSHATIKPKQLITFFIFGSDDMNLPFNKHYLTGGETDHIREAVASQERYRVIVFLRKTATVF